MEAVLLILAALSLTLLTISGLRLAFARSAVWGWVCALIPPAWVAFYSSRWDVMRTQAVIHLTAFCAVCLCGVLYIRAHPHPRLWVGSSLLWVALHRCR